MIDWLIKNDIPIMGDIKNLYVVGNCRDCSLWGKENEKGVVRTCRQNKSQRTGTDDCVVWEPIKDED